MLRRLFSVVSIGLALGLSVAEAQVAPREAIAFDAKARPFLPRLLTSHDPPLCDAFLEALRKDYVTQHRGKEHLFSEPPMTVGQWMTFPSQLKSDDPRDGGTEYAELDLDKNGGKQLLIHVTHSFNWAGNWYYLFVRPAPAADDLPAEIAAFQKALPQDQPNSPLKLIMLADLPAMWKWGAYDGYQSPIKVLSYDGAAYLYTFVDGIMHVGGSARKSGTAGLERIRADGTRDLVCLASAIPRAGSLPLWISQSESADTASVPEEALDWMRTIRALQGSEGKFAGTGHFLSGLIIRSSYVWHDALVRPWDALVLSQYYNPSAVGIRAWIQNWGYQSLSQFRPARDFEAGRRATLRALESYYERAFAVPNAKQAAAAVVDRIISASFVITGMKEPDSSFTEPHQEQEFESIKRDAEAFAKDPEHHALSDDLFHSALLVGVSPETVTAMIKGGAVLTGYESALFFALEHPDEVKALLDAGANVNDTNGFGKTALMYAAHYNLSETVTLLLAHGADVAKRTDGSQVLDTFIQFDRRSALMYAAENASADVMRKLVDAGADVCATDTGHRDMWSYVGRNRRLTDEDRKRAALVVFIKPCAPRNAE